MIKFLSEARKAIAAVLGVAGLLVSTGLLHGQALTIVNFVVAALTAATVYLVPNAQAPVPVAVFAPTPTPEAPAAGVPAPTPPTV